MRFNKTVIIFTIAFLSLNLGATGSIGGSSGGPGAKTWNIEIPKGTTVDWPMIRVHEGRNLPINHFCIEDDETLRTLAKYGPKYDIRLDTRTILRFDRTEQTYQTADRYFDGYGCYGSGDPKCDVVNTYIEETVRIPVYKGRPQTTRGGMEDIRDFARRALLYKEIEATIPKCNQN